MKKLREITKTPVEEPEEVNNDDYDGARDPTNLVKQPVLSNDPFNDNLSEGIAEEKLERHYNHLLKIRVPKGHPGAYVDHISANKGEREFILPRDTKLKHTKTVTTEHDNHDHHVHHMEIV